MIFWRLNQHTKQTIKTQNQCISTLIIDEMH